jgi:hypothetical protein
MKRLLLGLLLCGCPSEKEKDKKLPEGVVRVLPDGGLVTKNPVVPLPQKTSNAEVEFEGDLDPGGLTPARVVVVFSKTACSGDLDVIQKEDVKPGHFAGELFFPQGTLAHICALGLDAKGEVIGIGTHEKNPVSLQGDGEVVVSNIKLKLAGVQARQAPKGL